MVYLSLILAALLSVSCRSQTDGQVEITVNQPHKEVLVTVDGEPFTTYRYGNDLEKPVLYPVFAPGGVLVTRGFPIEPRERERVDHPHHVGIWFNFGDVNGYDFWNNSYAVPSGRKQFFGRIVPGEIARAESGKGKGILEVKMDWIAPDNDLGEKLLEEETTYIFRKSGEARIIDRITKLTSTVDEVVFTDNKEGLLAIRVDRAFELPSDEPLLFTDGSGNPTQVPVLDNEGVTGWYRNSEGIEGDDAWGKRAEWVKLSGNKGGGIISLVMVDHPLNPGYPSCWHARGYGLFSVNNMGRKVFDDTLEPFKLILKKGESVTFRHRFVVATGDLTDAEIELLKSDFIKD